MKDRYIEPEIGHRFKELVLDYLCFVHENNPDELDIDSRDEPAVIDSIVEFSEYDRYGKGEVTTTVTYTSDGGWADQYIFPGSFAEFAVVVSRF